MPCVAVSSSVRSVAIVFLVAARLEGILSPAALGDVQLESGEPRDVAGRVAFGASQTLHPSHGAIGEHDAVGVIPPVLRLQNLFECAAHPRTVFDVHAREPRLEHWRFFRREAELCAEGVIPVGVIRAEVPCPGAACRRFEREASRVFCSRSAASARVRSTASQVRSATSRTSSISAAVHTRGVS